MKSSQLIAIRQRVGVPGSLGLAMVFVAGWFHFHQLPAMVQTEQDLAQQVRRTRHQVSASFGQTHGVLESGSSSANSSPTSPQQIWAAVWQALPSDAEQQRMLTFISRAADQHQLTVTAIQYSGQEESWSRQTDQVLWRQRITLPVEGRYVDVRGWLARLLSQPYIALESLDMARLDASGDLVRGQVQLSLWWKRSLPPAPRGQDE